MQSAKQCTLKLSICTVYDLAISLLGIYTTDTISYVHKKSCARIFTALFIKPQSANQCTVIKGRIKKVNLAETHALE